MFVNGTEIYKLKAKDSEIVAASLYLGNISKNWSADNMKKTGFTCYIYDYDTIAVNDILDISKYLLKKKYYCTIHIIKCLYLLKKSFLPDHCFIW